MLPLTFYAGRDEYRAEPLGALTPLLRPAVVDADDSRGGGDLPRRVWSWSEADFVALPKVWGEYVRQGSLKIAAEMAAEAAAAGKILIVWHTGDLNPIMPFHNGVVMVNALERSRRRANWHVAPRFIDDPLPLYADGRLQTCDKGKNPRVGFCGFAAIGAVKLTYTLLSNLQCHAASSLRVAHYEPPPLVPATLLRAKVLDVLAGSRDVETDFIIRKRYKAGTHGAGPDHWSVREFYGNILSTDYTVCVRGYGNWSIRLYETLACGRIPIVIDTDCGLPFDRTIDWKDLCVWVPAADVARTAEYVVRFHDGLSSNAFRRRQEACRALWESRLTLTGFLRHFHEHFADIPDFITQIGA